MVEAHGGLGELLVILYLAIAVASFIVARRRVLPSWVTGTAHALLGVQILMGIILYIRHPHVMPISHVIAGLLTIPALGLIVPLRRSLGRARGTAVTSLVVGVLAAIAVTIAMTR